MRVEHLEVLVEEPSMEAALRILLPRILSGKVSFEIYRHLCKDDLLMRLPARLRGYASWLPSSWRILVIVDVDDDHCVELKRRLDLMAEQAGLTTRSRAAGSSYAVVNRLAVEELEAWFFGDWEAVVAAYPHGRDDDPVAGEVPRPRCDPGRHLRGARAGPPEGWVFCRRASQDRGGSGDRRAHGSET
ncbi:DUF4276 family protein [Sorangium sp. So ce1036]